MPCVTRARSPAASFLVSLALALALSDLVSHKTRIDSLFLDEGFGTLDSETLDTATDALDALNATGKTIGVISHVEAMKERIPVQIKVKNQRTGLQQTRQDVCGGVIDQRMLFHRTDKRWHPPALYVAQYCILRDGYEMAFHFAYPQAIAIGGERSPL